MSITSAHAIASDVSQRGVDTGVLSALLALSRRQPFAEQDLAHVMNRFGDLAFRIRAASRAGARAGRRPIVTLRDALNERGYRGAHHAALASAYATTLPRECVEPRYRDFWRHAGATALLARLLAVAAQSHNDHAFAAGLLHSVGDCALSLHRAQPSEAPQSEELATAAGVEILKSWQVPPVIVDAVALRHAGRFDATPEPPLAGMVAGACACARMLGMEDGLEPQVERSHLAAQAGPALAAMEQFGDRPWLEGVVDEVLAAALVSI